MSVARETLVISCLGDQTGGGLFAFDGAVIEEVDALTCTGLAVAGGRLLRVLPSTAEVAELLVYDNLGIQQYHRLDGVSDPHDIAWDGENFVIVSTLTNSIVWVSSTGAIQRSLSLPGTGDCWHLNSLAIHDGAVLVSAFGRFRRHREWAEHKSEATGILYNPVTGEEVLGGLRQPHHPRFVDGAWLICNSAAGELLEIDASSRETRRRAQLRGYVRGLAVTEDALYVGQSAKRSVGANQQQSASLVVIDRTTWDIRAEVPVRCQEIYDVVIAPSALLNGVRRGFRTNPHRVVEQNQHALFAAAGVPPRRLWAIADPLPSDACKVQINVELEPEVATDDRLQVHCSVENRGAAILVSAPPYPVVLSYKWFTASGAQRIDLDGIRTPLPGSLPPGESLNCVLTVQTPPDPGDFILVVTLLQEHVAWFDDLDPTNGWRQAVSVVAFESDPIESVLSE